MDKTNRQPSLAWRVFLTALLAALLGFIFYNSLQTGEESSAQSGGVTELVQEIARKIAPRSFIATAAGEDYEALHALVRLAAHFLEFYALGAIMVWCFYSYTFKKRHTLIAFLAVCITAGLDEWLQSLTNGRAAQMQDFAVDCLGGGAGCLFAVLVLVTVLALLKKGESYGKS